MSTPTFAQPAPQGESGWNLKVAVLFGAVIALLAANIYLFVQVDRVRTDLTKFRESTLTEIANLREASSVTAASNRKHLETMKEELEAARRQASMAVGQAKVEALKRAEQLNAAVMQEQKRQEARMTSQISEVRQATSDASNKIGEVNADVTTVKGDVAATKAQLEKTIADLKRVNGDMGMMSGLIATNGKELSALRQLGERNYVEFDLKKTKAPQKVGDIAIQLKRTDQKRNKFTIDVIADDKRIEKKDRTINEPVQFLVARAPHQPYELVVNEVRKNQIVGYLSIPKVLQGR